MSKRWPRSPCLLSFALLLLPVAAGGTVFNVTPADDLETIINAAMPGDEVVLAGGNYDLTPYGFFDITVSGTPAAPIVIRAADGEVPVLSQTATREVLSIYGSHLVFRGLELTGGFRGMILEATATFVTVEDCHVHDVEFDGIAATRFTGDYEGLLIRRNEIHDIALAGGGNGISLGCVADASRAVGTRDAH